MAPRENIPPVAVRCGARIRMQRRQRKLTQRALAIRAGLSPQYVSNIEKGEVNPPIGTIEQLAAALEVRLSTLLEDEGPPGSGGAELPPLVFGLVADIHTAQTVLAATVPKLHRLSQVTGIPMPLMEEFPPRQTPSSGLQCLELLPAFSDLCCSVCV